VDEIRSDRLSLAGAAYLEADAEDRRVALQQAVALFNAALDAHRMSGPVLDVADSYYWWLRRRPSLKPARLVIQHGPVVNQPGH
jgi:hypothetical protein